MEGTAATLEVFDVDGMQSGGQIDRALLRRGPLKLSLFTIQLTVDIEHNCRRRWW